MKKLFSKSGGKRTHAFDPAGELLPEKVFWMLLDRERNLADRGGRPFALLVFDLASVEGRNHHGSFLVRALLSRLRCSDAAGWVESRRIGALLANSSAEDARRVAESICKHCAELPGKLTYEVFAYPAVRGKNTTPGGDFIGDRARSVPGSTSLITDAPRVHEMLAPAVPWWKRLLDIVVALAMLIALSPVLLLLALFIKLVSPGPVFFRQQRVGWACQTFTCLKFRTMHVNADPGVHAQHVRQLMREQVPMAKLDDGADRRLIPLARLIRASGVDELPQLINVLLGDMSLVGPRPCVPYEYEGYENWHLRRFDTLPGLTGLWQVSGKNLTTFQQMMRYDVGYARHLSPSQDALILLRTGPAVVQQVARATHHGDRRSAA